MGGCPAPVDLTYGSGVPSPALAAQQAQNDPATAMAVMQAHPFEVEQIATNCARRNVGVHATLFGMRRAKW